MILPIFPAWRQGVYSRILTASEREKIKAYLAGHKERDATIRSFVSRAHRYGDTLREDLRLVENLVRYDRKRKRA
jgi:hypothetical protein